jgi:hypothetical protein
LGVFIFEKVAKEVCSKMSHKICIISSLTCLERFQECIVIVGKPDGHLRPRRVTHSFVEGAEAGEDAEGRHDDVFFLKFGHFLRLVCIGEGGLDNAGDGDFLGRRVKNSKFSICCHVAQRSQGQ